MTKHSRVRQIIGLLAVALGSASALAQQAGRLQEQPNDIEYPTPQAAVAALRNKPGVAMTTQNGWLVASDPSDHTTWSFPPPTNPAYPAVVRRQIYVEGDQVLVKMGVKCGGTKLACDEMVLSFERLNQKMREDLSHAPGAVSQ